MTRFRFLALAGSFASLVRAQAPQTPVKTNLKVGDMAPDFTLPSTAGGTVVLIEF